MDGDYICVAHTQTAHLTLYETAERIVTYTGDYPTGVT